MGFGGALCGGSWLSLVSCSSGLLLCLEVVVPVAFGSEVVEGCGLVWLPLCDVCCLELCGFWAACAVLLCDGALLSVAFEALVA